MKQLTDTINNVLASSAQRDEAKSWTTQTTKYFYINAVVKGYGINRDIPATDYAGNDNEPTVRAMAKTLKSKGFEVEVYQYEKTRTRLI